MRSSEKEKHYPESLKSSLGPETENLLRSLNDYQRACGPLQSTHQEPEGRMTSTLVRIEPH